MRTGLIAPAAVLVTVLYLTAASAEAATITVRPGGPVATIAEAVAQAKEGDRIVLSPGTYSENVEVTTDRLTFTGRNVVWDGSPGGKAAPCLWIQSEGCKVQGITFGQGADQVLVDGPGAKVQRCAFRAGLGGGVTVRSAGTLVDRCTFLGPTNGVRVLTGATDTTIRRCAVFHSYSVGILADTASGLTVDRCTISHAADAGISLLGGTGAVVRSTRVRHTAARGIHVADLPGVTISRCTIDDTESDAVYVTRSDGAVIEKSRVTDVIGGDGIYAGAAAVRIAGNRVAGTYGHGIRLDGDDARIEGNTVTESLETLVRVRGARCALRGNRLSGALGSYGIDCVGAGTVVEDTSVADTVGGAVNVDGAGCTLRNVRVTTANQYRFDFAVHAAGDGSTLTGVSVTDVFGDGLVVFGNGVTVSRCSVRTSGGDGIYVQGGDGVTIDRCTVSGCDDSALENRGTGTNVTGCRFRDCRILLASSGTFGTFSGNNVSVEDAVPPGDD